MSPRVEVNSRSAFSRPLAIQEVPPEGLDVTISATEAERQAVAADDGLQGLAKLEASLHVAPSPGGGLAVTGEMRARITQTCVVTLNPFDSEIVEPIDVKFAPVAAPQELATPGRLAVTASRRRRRGAAPDEPPAPVIVEFEGEDPPDPIIDGRIDLGALVAEFLALALDPYPRKPGVAFQATRVAASGPAESPFAELERLKANLLHRS
jgi:hypothetical protein